MKKRVIAAALLSAMVLTGCGSKGFTGEKTGEVDSQGNKTIATVQFEEGTPVSVNIDVIQADGSSKVEASESGAYDMKNEPGKKWHEQVDLLEEAIVANNFEFDKLNVTEGKTDAVSGVTISVDGYIEAVEAALEQAK